MGRSRSEQTGRSPGESLLLRQKSRSQKRTGFLTFTSYLFTITSKRSAAAPRIIFRVNAEKLRKTALPIPRAADCRPYGNDREIGAENVKFLRGKTYIKSKFFIIQPVLWQKAVRRVHILHNKPCERKKSFHSQDLIYYDLKMTICKLPQIRLTAKS